MNDPYVPMKKKMGNEKSKPKFRSEWMKAEVKKVQVNVKAINTLYSALKSTEFNQISTCKTTKEIWDKLKVTHKRTTQVKESKIAFLSNQYEMFKMQYIFVRLIYDDYKSTQPTCRVISKDELVKRLLKSLSKI